MAAGSPAAIYASRQEVAQDTAWYFVGDMQLAVDGRLYFTPKPLRSHPVTGSFTRYLGVIRCPNVGGPGCGVDFRAIELPPGQDGGDYLPTHDQTLFVNANRVQASANPAVLCAGDTARLVAYGGGATTVRWFPATGLSSDTARTPQAYPAQTTTYTVVAQRACGPPDTARVRVVVTTGASVVRAGRDTAVCAGATLRLGGSAPDPQAVYLWGPARYLSNARAARPLLTVPLVARDTVLVYVLRAECSSLPPDTVRVLVRARAGRLGLPLYVVCPGESLLLGAPAAPATAYQWAPAAPFLSSDTLAQPLFRVPARAPLADTLYVFRRTTTRRGVGCATTDSVQVRVRAAPQAPQLLVVSADTVDARRLLGVLRIARPADFTGAALALEAQPFGQPFADLQALPRPAAGAEAAFAVEGVEVAAPTAYRLRGEWHCATVWSATHAPVTLTAVAADSLGSATLQWSGYRGWVGGPQYTVLGRRGGGGAFVPYWSGTDTTLLVPAAPARITEFRIRATAPDGRRSFSNTVTLRTQPQVRAYNILTPNADGLNDRFEVENLAYYPGSALAVYDRWGRQVFYSADYHSGDWTATALAAGVYFYRLTLPGSAAVKGWVTVVK